MDTVTWLANGLIQLNTPDPTLAPPLAERKSVFEQAFTTWGAPDLVDRIALTVRKNSSGEVTVRPADSATFRLRLRNPESAYLLVTGQRRFILTPDAEFPVRYDT